MQTERRLHLVGLSEQGERENARFGMTSRKGMRRRYPFHPFFLFSRSTLSLGQRSQEQAIAKYEETQRGAENLGE